MKRNLNREEVKAIIKYAISKSKTKKYKDCIKYLNIEEKEYKKFLDFMRDYRIM